MLVCFDSFLSALLDVNAFTWISSLDHLVSIVSVVEISYGYAGLNARSLTTGINIATTVTRNLGPGFFFSLDLSDLLGVFTRPRYSNLLNSWSPRFVKNGSRNCTASTTPQPHAMQSQPLRHGNRIGS